MPDVVVLDVLALVLGLEVLEHFLLFGGGDLDGRRRLEAPAVVEVAVGWGLAVALIPRRPLEGVAGGVIGIALWVFGVGQGGLRKANLELVVVVEGYVGLRGVPGIDENLLPGMGPDEDALVARGNLQDFPRGVVPALQAEEEAGQRLTRLRANGGGLRPLLHREPGENRALVWGRPRRRGCGPRGCAVASRGTGNPQDLRRGLLPRASGTRGHRSRGPPGVPLREGPGDRRARVGTGVLPDAVAALEKEVGQRLAQGNLLGGGVHRRALDLPQDVLPRESECSRHVMMMPREAPATLL